MKEGEIWTEYLNLMKELTVPVAGIKEENHIVTVMASLSLSYATIVIALDTKMDNLTLYFL